MVTPTVADEDFDGLNIQDLRIHCRIQVAEMWSSRAICLLPAPPLTLSAPTARDDRVIACGCNYSIS